MKRLGWSTVFASGILMVIHSQTLGGWEHFALMMAGLGVILHSAQSMGTYKRPTKHWYQLHVAFKDKQTGTKRGDLKVRISMKYRDNIINDQRGIRIKIGKEAYKEKWLYGTDMEVTVLSYLGEFAE